MLSLKQFLTEKLITFRKKAYPKFNTVVIMGGGAGSGKGFIKSNLIGLEGWSFDVDEIKRFAIMASSIRKKVKEKFGKNIADFNLKKPEDVASLHDFVSNFYSTYGLDSARQRTMFRSILMADPTRKPNLIFDVTLKSLSKLKSLSDALNQMGYDKKDIHIVWVVNDIEVALKQNEKRARTVPAEILVNTHRGVSQTMQDIVAMGKDIKKYMDGDIVFAFNKVGVDSELAKSERGGSYIKTANYFYIKRAGEAPMSVDKIKKELGAKISDYVPKNVSWV